MTMENLWKLKFISVTLDQNQMVAEDLNISYKYLVMMVQNGLIGLNGVSAVQHVVITGMAVPLEQDLENVWTRMVMKLSLKLALTAFQIPVELIGFKIILLMTGLSLVVTNVPLDRTMLENTVLIGENGVNGDPMEDVQKNAEEVLKQEIVTVLVEVVVLIVVAPSGTMNIENARTMTIRSLLQSRIKIHFVTKVNPHNRVGNVIKNLAEMQDGQWVMDKGKAACLITSMSMMLDNSVSIQLSNFHRSVFKILTVTRLYLGSRS